MLYQKLETKKCVKEVFKLARAIFIVEFFLNGPLKNKIKMKK